jgi:hypothetical protein
VLRLVVSREISRQRQRETTMTAMTKRLARAVLIAGLALPAMTLLPANAPFAITKAHAEATTMAEFKSVLANYGKWGTHDKYGDIWVPGVTPPGWHPYPACQWVFTKEGWYFNDQTPWGAIVHHYGRWSHDEEIGWFWVPDQNWSPGWVVWRKSDQWIGWAPMPPEQDVQLVSTAAFNNDKFWIFMAAQKFLNGGCGDTVQASQAFYQTAYTNWFGLPSGLLVDIDIDQHWTIKNIIKIIKIDVDIDIDIDIDIDKDCPPNPNTPRNKISPIHFNNPPKDRRTSNDPTPDTPVRTVGTPPTNVQVLNNPSVKIDLPLNPGRGGTRGGGNGGTTGGGGTITRGDGGGSDWKRPHLSILNPVGHGLNLNTSTGGSSGPVRTVGPVGVTGPKVMGVAIGPKSLVGGLNTKGGTSVIR